MIKCSYAFAKQLMGRAPHTYACIIDTMLVAIQI